MFSHGKAKDSLYYCRQQLLGHNALICWLRPWRLEVRNFMTFRSEKYLCAAFENVWKGLHIFLLLFVWKGMIFIFGLCILLWSDLKNISLQNSEQYLLSSEEWEKNYQLQRLLRIVNLLTHTGYSGYRTSCEEYYIQWSRLRAYVQWSVPNVLKTSGSLLRINYSRSGKGRFEMGECLTIVWLIEITANVLILRHAGRH